jgi:hypothetical protein
MYWFQMRVFQGFRTRRYGLKYQCLWFIQGLNENHAFILVVTSVLTRMNTGSLEFLLSGYENKNAQVS